MWANQVKAQQSSNYKYKGEIEREGKHKIYSGSVSILVYIHSSRLPLEYFHYSSNRFSPASLPDTCKTFTTIILLQKFQKTNSPKQPTFWCYQISQVFLSQTLVMKLMGITTIYRWFVDNKKMRKAFCTIKLLKSWI